MPAYHLDSKSLERYYLIRSNVSDRKIDSMMKKLRGRNLAHPGCLIGITVGMTLGIVLAEVLAAVFNVALNTVLLSWLGLTIGLGAIGWVVGKCLSSKFPALRAETQPASPPNQSAP